MSLELQVLRTAKAALDEGLLDQDDYANVKAAFMKALSIKGGVDNGFLTDDDMAEARREFFQSAGMPGLGGGNNNYTPRDGGGQPQQAPAPQTSTPPRPAAAQTNGHAQHGVSSGAAAPPPARQPSNLSIPERTSPGGAGRTPSSTAGTPSRKTPAVGTPSGISTRGGGAQAVADKKSMSGISVHPDAVNIVWELRVKKAYRWVIFKIEKGGTQVIIETAAEPSSTWDEFIGTVPANECRYGVYDYEYVNSEGVTFGKLTFLSWAPDTAPTKAKMQHASTKDLFRGLLEGVSVEVHATDAADLAESIVRERVASTVARK